MRQHRVLKARPMPQTLYPPPAENDIAQPDFDNRRVPSRKRFRVNLRHVYRDNLTLHDNDLDHIFRLLEDDPQNIEEMNHPT